MTITCAFPRAPKLTVLGKVIVPKLPTKSGSETLDLRLEVEVEARREVEVEARGEVEVEVRLGVEVEVEVEVGLEVGLEVEVEVEVEVRLVEFWLLPLFGIVPP